MNLVEGWLASRQPAAVGPRYRIERTGPVGLALDIVVPDAPELVVASPSVNPPNPALGQSFTLSVANHNRGNAPAPPTTVRYYLSTDSTTINDDTEVGTVGGLAPKHYFQIDPADSTVEFGDLLLRCLCTARQRRRRYPEQLLFS